MNLSGDANILWQIAKALAARHATVSPHADPLPPLLFFTDPQRTLDPVQTIRRLPAGAAVVYRAFSAADAVEKGLLLRQACDEAGVILLVGRDPRLAEAIKADGLHLPERDIQTASIIRDRYPAWLITGAIHTMTSLSLAQNLDAAVVSPVFQAGGASADKPVMGTQSFQHMVEAAPCPVYALGGIKPSNARQLLSTGACGLAGVDAIQTAFAG